MNPHIARYRTELQETMDFGGSLNETAIRGPFINMVNGFAESRNLKLLTELEYKTSAGTTVRPDGTLKDRWRFSLGYYEAKDTKDDLDKEIAAKTRAHYPLINTIFENSRTAVLYQNSAEVMRIDMQNDRDLETLITRFLDFEREEIATFKKALITFTQDLPELIAWCREQIDGAKKTNEPFVQKINVFLEQCREEVNADFAFEDVREILIQHILTDKLFSVVLSEGDFHKNNNIAKHINEITETFFTQALRKDFEMRNNHFYAELSRAAKDIADFHDKEAFLKTLYEEFYKAYNPKEADRLGVVYTPGEIVDFMIKTSDTLLARHFNTGLAEKGVQIIDPACGTGTFITALVDYIPLSKLQYKYAKEIYANEVSILPYYVANLNIEYTYWQKMQAYNVFPNISYTDTLESCRYMVDAHGQGELGSFLTPENTKRIWAQNEAEISVVIGNPPYNANQKNYNEQNANKTYPEIDKRVRETFTAESRAQKTKYEDMYFRFYRWGMDRLSEKRGGLVAFVTNRSFIDAINTDGFRAAIEKEFDYLYIVDLQSDVRKNPKISGTKHNVFGIQTGVAIMFAVKTPKDKQERAVVQYFTLRDEDTRREKLDFLKHTAFAKIDFSRLYPDEKHTWLNISESDFGSLLPVWEADSSKKSESTKDSLFYKCFPGISTNRDEWVYDFSRDNLIKKMKRFIKVYNKSIREGTQDFSIKWSRDLTNNFLRQRKCKFDEKKIIFVLFRPFVKKYFYADGITNDVLTTTHLDCIKMSDRFTQNHIDCVNISDNIYLSFCGAGHNHEFCAIASKYIPDLHALENSQCLPFYILNKSGKKDCNIKDAALAAFREHYDDGSIQKKDLFHYLYAVFNSAEYREKYRHELRRERPRIPFDADFWERAKAGADLMETHVNFENAPPYPLTIHKAPETETLKPQFKFDKKGSHVIMDEYLISGFPPAALEYRLGIRSPVEWVVDQYKKDYTDYKEEVLSLLGQVTGMQGGNG